MRGKASVKRSDCRHKHLPIGLYYADMYNRGGSIVKNGRIRAYNKGGCKSFSIAKYGEAEAIKLGIKWRHNA